jgi:hypothetical protein
VFYDERMYFEQIVSLCCVRSAVSESAPSHTETSLFDNDESFKDRCLQSAEEIVENTEESEI